MSYDGTDGWHGRAARRKALVTRCKRREVLINHAFELWRDMGFRSFANMTLHGGNFYTL